MVNDEEVAFSSIMPNAVRVYNVAICYFFV